MILMYSRVYVEITDICNRNCSFCPGTVRAPRRMSEEEFRKVAEKLKSVTKYLYFHVMGEPLTHPLLPDFIRIAKENGFFATLNHPFWSLEGYEQYIHYSEFDALEVFNTACEMLGFTSSCPGVYDDMLRSGKKLFAVAADDVHNGVDDTFGGFVMIKADELKYNAIKVGEID